MDFLDLDINLSKEDIMLKQNANEFARKVMRPIAKELDAMTPEQVIAKDSPFWTFMKKGYELGYHSILIPDAYGGMGLTPLQQAIVYEELAWGSVGLTIALGEASFPAFGAAMVPEETMIDEILVPFCENTDATFIGCWGITEPDHESDTLMPGHPSFSDANIPSQCVATPDGMDVTDPESVKTGMDAFAVKTGGRMDVLLNNAGILKFGLFENVDLCDHLKIVDVNINGRYF